MLPSSSSLFERGVVDDDVELREMIKMLLEAHHYNVSTAENGKVALRLISENTPDLILSDIKMKDMDGYTFVQELKNRDLLKSLKVVILTGYQDMQDLFSMKEIADYILKPFDNDDLLLRISRVLGK